MAADLEGRRCRQRESDVTVNFSGNNTQAVIFKTWSGLTTVDAVRNIAFALTADDTTRSENQTGSVAADSPACS